MVFRNILASSRSAVPRVNQDKATVSVALNPYQALSPVRSTRWTYLVNRVLH